MQTQQPQSLFLRAFYSREQLGPSASTIRAFCELQGVSPCPPRTLGLVIDTANRIWHLVNSLYRLLNHVFGTSFGTSATPANSIPATTQRLAANRFRHLGRLGLILVRVDRHHLLKHTPCFDPIILQLHSTSRRRRAHQFVSAQVSISPDKHHAWLILVREEKTHVFCTAETPSKPSELQRRQHAQYLHVSSELLRCFGPRYKAILVLSRCTMVSVTVDISSTPRCPRNATRELDFEPLTSKTPARFTTHLVCRHSGASWQPLDAHTGTQRKERSRQLPTPTITQFGGFIRTPLSSQTWKNADNLSRDSS